jgi:hypothetical protein
VLVTAIGRDRVLAMALDRNEWIENSEVDWNLKVRDWRPWSEVYPDRPVPCADTESEGSE